MAFDMLATSVCDNDRSSSSDDVAIWINVEFRRVVRSSRYAGRVTRQINIEQLFQNIHELGQQLVSF